MAIASGLPVLPVTIHGTFEAWRPGTLWVRGGQITTVIDAPIPTTGLFQQDSGELAKQAYEIIAGRVSEMGGHISV
jgi:1-acyl-sn-glycerol-3-phosphate acyltransferase